MSALLNIEKYPRAATPFFPMSWHNKDRWKHGFDEASTALAELEAWLMNLTFSSDVVLLLPLAAQHWFGEVGRLVVNGDLSLSLDSFTPMLGLDEFDPISISYPWIQKIDSAYHMWYGSTSTWDAGNGEMIHTFKHAISDDGLNWTKMGGAIPHEIGVAQAFSRPTVLADDNDNLTMWFSYRSGSGEQYQIGQSLKKGDGPWSKVIPAPGLSISNDGWDSEMLEYPYVFSHSENVFMLYNGNGYGASGFGLAVLEK